MAGQNLCYKDDSREEDVYKYAWTDRLRMHVHANSFAQLARAASNIREIKP